MPRKITNGWQWPKSQSSSDSEDSRGSRSRVHYQTSPMKSPEKHWDRLKPHRSIATTVVPTVTDTPTAGSNSEEHTRNPWEAGEAGSIPHTPVEHALLRWQLAAMALLLIATIEAVLLCFAISGHLSICARVRLSSAAAHGNTRR